MLTQTEDERAAGHSYEEEEDCGGRDSPEGLKTRTQASWYEA